MSVVLAATIQCDRCKRTMPAQTGGVTWSGSAIMSGWVELPPDWTIVVDDPDRWYCERCYVPKGRIAFAGCEPVTREQLDGAGVQPDVAARAVSMAYPCRHTADERGPWTLDRMLVACQRCGLPILVKIGASEEG